MAERSVIATQSAGKKASFSPLSALIKSAVRRMGDFADNAAEADVNLMMLEFANRVVEDVRVHPYWQNGELHYYDHQSDVRSIPDMIVLDGLTYHYALQQGSKKAEYYSRLYLRSLNTVLYQRLYGNLPLSTISVDYTPPSPTSNEAIQIGIMNGDVTT